MFVSLKGKTNLRNRIWKKKMLIIFFKFAHSLVFCIFLTPVRINYFIDWMFVSPPKNSSVGVLTPCGGIERCDLWKVIWVRLGHGGGSVMMRWQFLQETPDTWLTLPCMHKEEIIWTQCNMVATYKSKEEATEWNLFCLYLDLGLQSPELRHTFLLFKPLN